MQTLHVLLRKEDLDESRLADSVVVVLDVLFATSTIAAALHHGATELLPVLDADEALAVGREFGEGSCLIAGEKNALPIEGFAPALPLSLLELGVAGRRIVYSTTNGTVALRRAAGARTVLAASLLNGPAVARHIQRRYPSETVLLVCAGSRGAFNLEDFYGAGYLVQQLVAGEPERWQLSDAALAARGLFGNRGLTPEQWLLGSRVGRLVAGMDFEREVRYAARLGELPAVPVVEGRALRLVAPEP